MNDWLLTGLWIGLALMSSLISIRVGLSVSLIEIFVGACAGNVVELTLTPWVNYLAAFGAILLTFLAGAEIDPSVIRQGRSLILEKSSHDGPQWSLSGKTNTTS